MKPASLGFAADFFREIRCPVLLVRIFVSATAKIGGMAFPGNAAPDKQRSTANEFLALHRVGTRYRQHRIHCRCIQNFLRNTPYRDVFLGL